MSRPRVKIKDGIIEALRNYPKTTHEVSRSVNCHYATAERNLKELKELGAVSQFENGEKQYWKLNK